MSNDYEITKLEITKLELKDGDVPAVKILGSAPASMADIERNKSYIKAMLPNKQALVYSECQVELSIVSGTKTINSIRRENGFAPIQSGNVCSKAVQPRVQADCDHVWVSAVNKVVKSGEICEKCFILRSPYALSIDGEMHQNLVKDSQFKNWYAKDKSTPAA